MAIPSLFHIWGKPKIKVAFDVANGYRLTCWIRNMPINRVISYFNVIRRQAEIIPNINITDKNREDIHTLHYAPNLSDDIRLPIAEVINPQKSKVYLLDEIGKSTHKTLEVGSYRLILELWWDSRKLLKKEKCFRINPSSPFIEEN
jgi:hypothetical protein